MKIGYHSVVTIDYRLEVDGNVVQGEGDGKPFDYIQGCHMLIEGLENALEGLEEGAGFDVTVGPGEAYGEYDGKSRFDIPKTSFEIDGKLREDLLHEGRMVPMLDSAGELHHARIIRVGTEMVTVDFNHPLAGKTLHFTGRIVSVREATRKELDEGLHGEFLPKEHGCGCHGGGCCHGDGHHEGHGGGCYHGEGHHDGHEGGCCHGEGRHDGHGGGCCHGDGAGHRQDR